VLDDFSTGHEAAVPVGARLVRACLSSQSVAPLEQLLAGDTVDVVVHLAARSLVPESMRDPGLYFERNVGGALALLEALRRHGSPHLIFSSSAAVYGRPAEVPIPETAPTSPINPYGESKLMIERMLHWYGEIHGLSWMALRYFNAAGALGDRGEDHHPETHLIPALLEVALERQPDFTVFGDDYPTPDGTCIRDYIHVADLAVAHRLAAECLLGGRTPSGVYNLGIGSGFSVRQVLETARRVTGASIPTRIGPRRAGDPPVLVACADRARETLGWVPRHADLEAMVASAWAFKRAHPDGYGPPRDR
jgi:UDP-glucose 4-epimerase